MPRPTCGRIRAFNARLAHQIGTENGWRLIRGLAERLKGLDYQLHAVRISRGLGDRQLLRLRRLCSLRPNSDVTETKPYLRRAEARSCSICQLLASQWELGRLARRAIQARDIL